VQAVVHARVHRVEVWPVQQNEADREVAASHIVNQRAAEVLDRDRNPGEVRRRGRLSQFVPVVYHEDTDEERVESGVESMPDRAH